jgi:uncharacterized membrane protein (UPF0127 family)
MLAIRLRISLVAVVLGLSALTACSETKSMQPDQLNTQLIKLPGGQTIRAEVMFRREDVMRGMKFRESLAPDHGMLFLHATENYYPYWMYEVKIPLDMIWMTRERRIVEIISNVKPCPGPPENCPSYGGRQKAAYVLELAGGMADKYGLKEGMGLEF